MAGGGADAPAYGPPGEAPPLAKGPLTGMLPVRDPYAPFRTPLTDVPLVPVVAETDPLEPLTVPLRVEPLVPVLALLVAQTPAHRLDEELYLAVNGLGPGTDVLWTLLDPHTRNYLILIGLTVEISLLFLVAGPAFVKQLPPDPRKRILGVPNRLLFVFAFSCVCVLVEIFLNSIDRDGMGNGYDLALIDAVSEATRIPVIACGGVGRFKHMVDGVRAGASAVSAANIFHFTEHSTKKAKEYLRGAGVDMRDTFFYKVSIPRRPRYKQY